MFISIVVRDIWYYITMLKLNIKSMMLKINPPRENFANFLHWNIIITYYVFTLLSYVQNTANE